MKSFPLFCCAILSLMAILTAEETFPQFTPSGMVQYRLRERIWMQDFMDTANDKTVPQHSADYRNMVGYNVGLSVKVNSTTSMQFSLGNDYVATEEINYGMNNVWQKTKAGVSYINLAYAKWNPGFMYLSFGKLPVLSNGPLDLLERSLVSGRYDDAAFIGWATGTNNSFFGLKAGAPILKNDLKVGIDLFMAPMENRTQGRAENPKTNPTSMMAIVDIPVTWENLTATIQLGGIDNRLYNAALETGDDEVFGGASATYKIGTTVTVSASGGIAQYSNENSKDTSVIKGNFKLRGTVVGCGASIAVGPGKAGIDIKYGTSQNTLINKSMNSYTFADLKYGWDINKNFQIMPRVRTFFTVYGDADAAHTVSLLNGKTEIRPEIIATAKF